MKLFKPADLTAILAVLLLAGGAFLFSARGGTGEKTAALYKNGELLRKVELDAVTDPFRFPIEGSFLVWVEVQNGKIRFAQAGCRDKLCVNAGWLTQNGDTAACLPSRIVITVTGGAQKADSPDVIVY
jgi:hypothetical protein